MTEILQTLKEYIPISLEEMSGIKLMNRTDTKYVTSYQILKEILLDLTFLEVKNRNNKGRTDKRRIRIGSIESIKEDGGDAFLRQHAWYDQSQLLPLLENSFHRVTLVNNHKTERLTIDTGVKFRCLQSGKISSLDNIVIIELKQDGHNSSPIKEILRKLHIQSSGFSKYCIGSALTVSHLKCNRLKPKLRMLNKIGVY